VVHQVTLFDDIVADAEAELPQLDAARAEIWVSGVFGTWRQAGVDDDLEPEDLDRRLLEHLAAHPSAGGLALAVAAAAIAPDRVADRAGEVAAALRSGGIEDPPWAMVAGSARPLAAWSLRDPHGGSESIVIGFEHADGMRHALLVEVDHDEGGMAVDLLFSPAELLDAVGEGTDPSLRTVPMEPVEASRRAVEALDRTRAHPDPLVTDEFLMNWYLADTRLRRVAGRDTGLAPGRLGGADGSPDDEEPGPSADPEGDAAASATLTGALRRELAGPEPADLADAAARFRAALGSDPDAAVLVEEAGVDPGGVDDVTLLVAAAGALVRPGRLRHFTPGRRRLVRSLEWADWLGVVVELVREGAGADADPARYVRLVNRCPEVGGGGIPARDAPGVVAAFEEVLFSWELTGAVDDGRLTAVGVWLLPRALLAAWSRPAPG
jgi:hypothetical protein